MDRDHFTGLQGFDWAGCVNGRAAGDALTRVEPEVAEHGGEVVESAAGEAGEGDGGGDVDEARFAESDGASGFKAFCNGAGFDGEHFFDGADAGDGFLGEGEGEGDCSHEAAIEVDGATAHPLHDAGFFQGAAGEFAEDDVLLGAEVFQDAEDFYLELFDLGAGEDGAAGGVLAGADFTKWDYGLWLGG